MYDLLIKNVDVVRPNYVGTQKADIAIKNGKVVKVATGITDTEAATVYDGQHQLAFPGLTDAHMHTGIYNPLEEDAITESKAAAMGGVTSSLNYMRTGKYYLNKTGPYSTFFPEVLSISKDRFYVDYSYHIAPIQYSHIDEIEMLIEKYGVTS